MTTKELIEALTAALPTLDHNALRQIMDIAECEIINRMCAEACCTETE